MNGNRCGHDPRAPRLELAVTGTRGKPFPHLIQRFLDGLEALYRRRDLFPELGARKRSERLEAMVLTSRALARNMDRLTLRVRPLTARTIASWARMGLVKGRRGGPLVAQRVYRALWDLRDAGYLELYQPIEHRPDGTHRGLAGVRRFTTKLFGRLGLDQALRRERRELWKAERARQTVETIAERKRLRRLFRESHRAAELAKRATRQLSEGSAPVVTDGGEARARAAIAELARRLAGQT